MSSLKGKVGQIELNWASVPRGRTGSAVVQVSDGSQMEVRWRSDKDGLWIETQDGVFGYDMGGQLNDDGARVYSVGRRGGDERWSALSFVRAGEEQIANATAGKKKGTRIRAQMPGKIVKVLVSAGSTVEKDQPLLVMEAMKMENEIRAPEAGLVKEVKVTEGQAVESGADLALLE